MDIHNNPSNSSREAFRPIQPQGLPASAKVSACQCRGLIDLLQINHKLFYSAAINNCQTSYSTLPAIKIFNKTYHRTTDRITCAFRLFNTCTLHISITTYIWCTSIASRLDFVFWIFEMRINAIFISIFLWIVASWTKRKFLWLRPLFMLPFYTNKISIQALFQTK